MRLQLTRRGDYAIRAMLLLAQEPGSVLSGAEIARRTNAPQQLVTQVMGMLVHADLARARIGRRGGYWTDEGVGATPILAIVEAVEGDARRQQCVLSGAQCSAANRCQVHDIFASAQEALRSKLAEASLDWAVRPATRSRRGRLVEARPPGRG
jgi:Rrf2 family protein